MNRSGLIATLGLVAVVIVVVVFAGQTRSGGPPLDPRSTGELGTRALVELLGTFGSVDVVEGAPTERHDTALLVAPTDSAGMDIDPELLAWANRGGRLVVFAGSTPLAAGNGGGATGDPDRGACDMIALDDVSNLNLATGWTKLVVEAGDQSCFGDGRQALVVANDRGAGTIVTIGSTTPFVNRYLTDSDNAVLAVSLLTPTPGTSVAIVDPPRSIGGGEDSLALLGPAFDRSVWQAVIAFGLLAIASAVRFGRPVHEPMPARIAGSELVSAVGGLMSDADEPDAAGRILRDRARDDLCRLCSLHPSAADGQLAALIAARTGVDEPTVLEALTAPTSSDAELVNSIRTLDDLRNRCRSSTGGTP